MRIVSLQRCAGIRHRRRSLGKSLLNNPDSIVLSVFEQQPCGTASCSRSQDPAASAAHRHAMQPCGRGACSRHELEAARTTVRREIPHHVTSVTSAMYQTVSQCFGLNELSAASESLQARLSRRSTSVRGRQAIKLKNLTPAEIICLSIVIERDPLLDSLSISGA